MSNKIYGLIVLVLAYNIALFYSIFAQRIFSPITLVALVLDARGIQYLIALIRFYRK